MAWLLLLLAAVLEVAWAVSLRTTEGFTRFWPSVISIGLAISDVYILGLVFKVLPSSYAYPAWVGLGMIGTVTLSCLLFKDSFNASQGLFIGVILLGIIGLKTASG